MTFLDFKDVEVSKIVSLLNAKFQIFAKTSRGGALCRLLLCIHKGQSPENNQARRSATNLQLVQKQQDGLLLEVIDHEHKAARLGPLAPSKPLSCTASDPQQVPERRRSIQQPTATTWQPRHPHGCPAIPYVLHRRRLHPCRPLDN